MILNDKRKLFVSQCIRIIATIIILHSLNIPIFMKILLIMITDSIDCGIPRFLFGSENWIDCDANIYQVSDKIVDTICYALLLFYLLNKGGLSPGYNYLIILLFIYRLIGVYLFLLKNSRKYLFYFPNFFLEICLGLAVINYFSNLKNFKVIILLIIFIYKIMLEYYLHFREIKNNFK
tara:strand:+ start:2232 stop:2765 length:534 start_codon:yes stop_codon:yes gene_type:complete